jgi:Plasmid pRiA4b ORF-3-like protein
MAKPKQVYRLKITLTDLQPSIWRRVEVEDCTLLKLHKIIQASMGWKNFHAWALLIDGEEYGDDVIDSGGDREFASARRAKLSRFVQSGVERFQYVYDFGDKWEHIIQIEKVLEADPSVNYPRCVKGSRACPPEDCGGPWGYEKLLNAIADSENEQYDEMLEWAGGEFDPEAFDIEGVNKELATVR